MNIVPTIMVLYLWCTCTGQSHSPIFMVSIFSIELRPCLLSIFFGKYTVCSRDEVFSSILLAFIGCFFFSHLGRIILLLIVLGLSTVFSFSIGGRYVVWINSGFFTCNRII